MTKTLFLPGATGNASFWKPAAAYAGIDGLFIAWPGLGDETPDPDVNGIGDLVALVLDQMYEPVNIVAQSMGGVVAVMAALARPAMVSRLALAVTSGGLPMVDLGGSEWRTNYRRRFPSAAQWIADPVPDLSSQLPAVAAPTLLLWGGCDPISPVAVGQRLHDLLPNATLHVIREADHDLALSHAERVGRLIAAHLAPVVEG
ncbi:alpha/beta hydrolase [Sphingopyxis indica]|uniref:alpha/beta fold hydrolase n=1 Tax=Sphingopyxis indica TaxID=436663 RepID=UPI0029391D4B|nr:alpha/beta hydrolase [Sphingopyxis indica]WOF43082.1 alpha/beta hydrolase [Sphingopyxis indica]